MNGQEVGDAQVRKNIGENEARENAVLAALRRVGGIEVNGTSREYRQALELEGVMSDVQFDSAVAMLKLKGKLRDTHVSSVSRKTQYTGLELVTADSRAM